MGCFSIRLGVFSLTFRKGKEFVPIQGEAAKRLGSDLSRLILFFPDPCEFTFPFIVS